jgi:hypothetical protein
MRGYGMNDYKIVMTQRAIETALQTLRATA